MAYMSKEVKPWDLLNPNEPKSSEELADARFEVCKGCEHFRQTLMTCKKCGCFMKAKSMLLNARCPIGKW